MPSFLSGNNNSGFSIGLIHRQYFSLVKNRLIFAYRLMLNANLGGSPLYYTRQMLTTFLNTEGFGGSGTIRGILMNRIVTGDFVLANFELRSRLVNFQLLNQNWYLGATLFLDAGRIVKPISINITGVPPEEKAIYFRGEDNTIHKSAGCGLKIVMNENFILSAEYAGTFDPQDGVSGIYLGLDYLF
jgi:hypothetical protein